MNPENSILLSNEQLKDALAQSEFAQHTLQQITKDFGTVGAVFSDTFFEFDGSIHKQLNEIKEQLSTLSSKRPNALQQLFYQIDIPETLVSDLSQSDDFYLGLAEVILKREAYKVFLRKKFSS